MRVTIACYNYAATTNTFIRQHATQLPGDIHVVSGAIPRADHESKLGSTLATIREFPRALQFRRTTLQTIVTSRYLSTLRNLRPDIVLAEFGPVGVQVMDACRHLEIPLVTHFFGYDASRDSILKKYRTGYLELFEYAAAIVGVSKDMCQRLIEMGAHAEKVHHLVCGVDPNRLALDSRRWAPDRPNTFLSIGRLTPKKAPLTCIRAFATVCKKFPSSNLIMIGDGPLRSKCESLIQQLELGNAIELRGNVPHEQLAHELDSSNIFIQHSVEADDGDREGTPVAILEAAARGLPIVATDHAGIPEVIHHERHGILVSEHNEQEMASAMIRLLEDADFAAALASAAYERVKSEFTTDITIAKLFKLLQTAASSRPH